MTSDLDEQLELLRIGDEKTPLVISLSKFRGMRFIDIRRYYFDKTTRTPKPSPKGIALKESEFMEIVNFLTFEKARLSKLFSTALSSEEIAHRGEVLERKARAAAKSNRSAYELKNWPALQFFSIDDSVEPRLVFFNTKIRLIQELSAESGDVFPYFAELLNAYNEAKASLKFTKSKTPEEIFEHVEIEWSKELNAKHKSI